MSCGVSFRFVVLLDLHWFTKFIYIFNYLNKLREKNLVSGNYSICTYDSIICDFPIREEYD